ncbi:MAG: LysR family transcriptional regulator [Elusimicrobia bacterium]|nr:LysR family transcriptional regulator [Elusimicrobiota bacterium]
MDLYQLKYFLEVARELNFTRAAGNLNVSPSAVSRSVALLESSIRKRLFTRTNRHVALTVFGDSLKARAEKIFDEVERARIELDGEARAPALLRIASREMITNYLLPGPLGDFKVRFGTTRFGLFELEPQELAAALGKDQVDLGFQYSGISDPGIESRLLGRLRSHVYAASRFTGRSFIAPRAFRPTRADASADGYPDHKHPRSIQYEAEFLETHRRFVMSGLCVGVLPDLVMAEERGRGEVVVLKGPPIHREVYCLKRRGRVLPQAVEFLIESIRKAIRRVQ